MDWNDTDYEERLRQFRPRQPRLPEELLDTPARSRRWWWAAAAALILIGVLSIPLLRDHREQSGDRVLEVGETARTDNNSGAMLSLPDGSRLEMRSNSQLALERVTDGLRIHLSDGSVLINAVKQGSGHLYVQTKDVTVTVIGTVFLVKAEEKGSRVAVIEGEVHVKQGSTETKLLPGERLASNPAMSLAPVKEEIAWSRNVETYVALLEQIAALTPPVVPQPPQQAAPVSNNGRIEGIVVASGTSQPLAGAELSLIAEGQRGGAESLAARTQGNGRFKIENVVPGNYRLQIRKLGYFSVAPTQTRYMVTSAVTVAPQQQITNLEFEMVQGGIIKGRVLDDNGQPLMSVRVTALQESFDQNGNPRFSATSPVSGTETTTPNLFATPAPPATDDRGEYRLFYLPPGRYYVRAGSAPAIPTYYPNANSPVQAVAINLTPGLEASADIALRKPELVTISGRLIEKAPPAGNAARRYNLFLLPRDPKTLTERSPVQVGNVSVTTGSEGRFTIPFVSPGDYMLVARNLTTGYAQTPIDVRRNNIDNAVLEVAAPIRVKFQVTVEGSGTPLDLTKVTAIGLRPERFDTPWATTRVAADGAAEISAVAPGPYVFQALQLPGDSYVADIRQGSRSVLRDAFPVDSDGEPLRVTLNTSGGKLEGTVVDANKRPRPALVTLVPVVRDRQPQTTVNLRVTSEANGKFSLGSLPPGEYKVFAWEEAPLGAEMNSEFLAAYDALATRVVVMQGGHHTVELRRISRK
jgi:hypothetical protein